MSKYKTNFLTKVLFKLDFPENIPIGNLQEFTKAIEKNFPTKEEKTETAIFFELAPENDGSRNKIEKITSWIFHSSDKKKRLGVSMRYIYFEYDTYNEFSEVENDIKETLIKFLNGFNVKMVSRIGLRYTNEISFKEPNQMDWTKYINEKLISAIEFVKDKKAARIMGHIVIKEELGDLTFNYGIWNKEYPNEINEKEFVLDIDCHSKLGISTDEIADTAKAYHSYIEKIFESSIEQQLKDKMDA